MLETAADDEGLLRPGDVYFSGDAAYASDYGPLVFECNVLLERACGYSEEEANGAMEIDRPTLIAQGYDGRIVRYENGDIDVIAFESDQISIVAMLPPMLKARR